MTQWSLLFSRLILRPLRTELLRTLLTVLSVALGVAVVVGVELAGSAAAGSFHSSLESLTGSAAIELRATGGIDERLLGKLVQLPEALQFAPRIEDFASIDGKGEALPFIGIDLIGSDVLRNSRRTDSSAVAKSAEILFGLAPRPAAGALLNESSHESSTAENEADLPGKGNPIWVGARLGFRKGDRVRLLINDQTHEFTVRDVLKQTETNVSEENVIVADIGLAQEVTGKKGRLDSISVAVPEGGRDARLWIDYLREKVPSTVSVEPVGSRTEENRKMLSGFRWNLRVLSYIALVVGAFLIYNTISVSVVRRRSETGIARALGATRVMVLGAFLAEAALFAVVGSALGLALGRLLALGAVRLLGSTVEALYVSSQPSPIAFTPGSLLAALCMGVGTSLAAALAPAYEASQAAPVEAMSRGKEEYAARRRSRWSLPIALVIALLAAAAAQAPAIGRQPIFGYAAALLLIVSSALSIPGLLSLFGDSIASATAKLGQVEALVAIRSLRASLRRTSVLIAALATAVAMMASVAIMVGSFRETVIVWMENQLKADLYLRPAGSAAADRHPTMKAEIADDIEKIPGVAAVDRFRAYSISYEGLPASLGGSETSKVRGRSRTRLMHSERLEESLDALSKGDAVLISEPFANKHHLKAGDSLQLTLGSQQPRFRVAGVYYDYSTERGFVIMDRKTLLRYLPDPAISNMAVYLEPGANADQVRRQIGWVIGGRGILLFSNERLRKEGIAIFDRTFRITWALEAVAIVVAVMGVAGALLALVIDRRREFGLLRFLGASAEQIRRIILAEAAFLGLLANCVGLALGVVLSMVLIFVINKQSFGWTIQFHWPGALLGSALAGVYLATILAALYPAKTAMRLNPIEVVHED